MLEEAVVRSHQIRCEMDTIKREFKTSAASLHKQRASCLRRAAMPMSSLRDVDADLAELAPKIHDVVLPLDERFEAYTDVKALNATRRNTMGVLQRINDALVEVEDQLVRASQKRQDGLVSPINKEKDLQRERRFLVLECAQRLRLPGAFAPGDEAQQVVPGILLELPAEQAAIEDANDAGAAEPLNRRQRIA